MGNGGVDKLGELGVVKLFRLVCLKDGDLGELCVGKLLAAVLRVHLGGLAALLDLAGDDLQHLLVRQLVLRSFRLLRLDRREEHTDRTRALLLLRLHRFLQVCADLILHITHGNERSAGDGTLGEMTRKQHTTRGSRFLRRAGAVTAAGAALGAGAFAYGVSELNKFRLKRYDLPILPAGSDPFTILHVSDLHMIPGQDTKIAWVSALDALNPDLVVNTGDNLSDKRAVPDVLAALGPLLDRPGVFVFGTNDYWAPRVVNPVKYLLDQKREPSYVDLPWKGMRAAFIERGWRDATHQRLEFKASGLKLAVTGTDDPHHDLDDYDSVAGAPNPDADLALGVTHAPYRRVLDRFAADGYALTLAGHTHGGQICLPGERAIVTNADIDRERASGLHRYGDMWLEVSNGLGTSKFAPVRIFCRPSAALLTLTAPEE